MIATPVVCPICGSDDVHHDDPDYSCNDCGSEFTLDEAMAD